jgi:phosphatidylserine/phosphatidylglycerophosphate/cardiolipin synthase-like enzyme
MVKVPATLLWGGCLGLVILGGVGSLMLMPHLGLSQRPRPLPQDAQIQVYFNHNQAAGADYRELERPIKRAGDNLEEILVRHINQAQQSIDVAVQELRLPLVAQTLVSQHQKGRRVRLVLENQYNQPIQSQSDAPSEATGEGTSRQQDLMAFLDQNRDGNITEAEKLSRDAILVLRAGGVPLIDDQEDGSKGTGLMHHKFVVIDGQTVIVTSANFTPSDYHGDYNRPATRGNANNFLVLRSPELAKLFSQEFNWLWGDGPGGAKNSLFGINKPRRPPQTVTVGATQVTVKFSPDSRKIPWPDTSNGLIARYLHQAQKSVDLALFVFSEQDLANSLQAPFQRGARVRALIDPGFAYRFYSEGLDLLGVTLLEKCQPEAGNQPWPYASEFVGIPTLAEGDKLHHKFAVIDTQTVISGSHNWSPSANLQNDETLLILQNPAIAAHYQQEFERLTAKAQWGLPDWLRSKIGQQQQICSTATAPAVVTGTGLVNLNTATVTELDSLPGIGPRLAAKIIETRAQQPFTSLEDLARVPGLKEGKLEPLRGKVSW